MTIDDYDKVYALWLSTKGMGMNDQDDSREGIRQYLLRNPSTSFVAEKGAEIAGTILSGHDGRRGTIYHLAVREDLRRRGIASRLLEEALTALRAEGIRKVFLVAFRNNQEGNAFWESQGFPLREDLSYRDKVLMEMLRIDT
ncbi:MAG: GNAT family N-acetyltransferase [Lachnospiraceae bacterium]|nr:GNAT family N-acetyltransferase [Lachnospiraceae bacterium]